MRHSLEKPKKTMGLSDLITGNQVKIKVLLMSDQLLIRQSLGLIISNNKQLELAGTVQSIVEGIKHCRKERIDIIVVNTHSEGLSGEDVLKKIKMQKLDVKIILLTNSSQERFLNNMIALGASACLHHSASPKILFNVIELLHKENLTTSEEGIIYEKKMKNRKSFRIELNALDLNILNLLAEGYTYKEVANKISLKENKVRYHISIIYRKLSVRNRFEAVKKLWSID